MIVGAPSKVSAVFSSLLNVELEQNVLITNALQEGSYSSYGKTPSYNVGQTPLYTGGRTPMHGSQTPLYECMFSLNYVLFYFYTKPKISIVLNVSCSYAAGSRTPAHYGSTTPVHDGSRTPGEAWNPSIMNTPARQSDIDSYNLDDSFNNMSNADYVPQTPGSSYASVDSSSSFSPFNSASPSSGYHSKL